MGMGNYACGADTIDFDFLREVCPKELDEFQLTLDKVDASFDDFCTAKMYEDQIEHLSEEENDLVDAVYDALKCEFEKQTELELDVTYHDGEDRGDELDGGTFIVDGVYQLTPAGEKYQKYITKKTWTVFG